MGRSENPRDLASRRSAYIGSPGEDGSRTDGSRERDPRAGASARGDRVYLSDGTPRLPCARTAHRTSQVPRKLAGDFVVAARSPQRSSHRRVPACPRARLHPRVQPGNSRRPPRARIDVDSAAHGRPASFPSRLPPGSRMLCWFSRRRDGAEVVFCASVRGSMLTGMTRGCVQPR